MSRDLAQFAADLRKTGDPRQLRAAIQRELGGVALKAQRESRLLATSRLKVRTGKLRQSIYSGTRLKGATVEAYIGSKTPYAAIQERGGIVRPRTARMLAIPLGAAKTRAGVNRQGPRDYADLFLIKSRGKLLLVRKVGDGIEPMFLLVHQTKIRPHWYLRDGMRTAAKTADPLLRKVLMQSAEETRG